MTNRHTVVFHIVRLAKKIQELSSFKFAPRNLSYSQAAALLVISTQKNISQVEISRKLHLRPATVVTLIDELEKLKLVKRTTALQNRRQYEITLTAVGKSLTEKIKEQTQKLEKLLKDSLSAKQAENLKSMLEKLTDAIESYEPKFTKQAKGGEK